LSLLHQKTLKHPSIDGKISVATGDGRAHGNAFFILRLNARLSDMYPNAWPRLDPMPHCPALVADAVRECVPNVLTPSEVRAGYFATGITNSAPFAIDPGQRCMTAL
jgi:hypothetical protein